MNKLAFFIFAGARANTIARRRAHGSAQALASYDKANTRQRLQTAGYSRISVANHELQPHFGCES